MTPTIPPGAELRLLLFAWRLDGPQTSAKSLASLVDRLSTSNTPAILGEYRGVAPLVCAWGKCHGLTDILTLAVREAVNAAHE